MNLPQIPEAWLEAATSLPLSQFIRESEWAFPAIESAHVIAVVLVFGTITIVDLRLIGVASMNRAVTHVTRETLKWTWMAFGLAVITGSLMAIAKLDSYVQVPSFWLKFAALFGAAINMAIFHALTFRNVHIWDIDTRVPIGAKVAGTLSILSWTIVIISVSTQRFEN